MSPVALQCANSSTFSRWCSLLDSHTVKHDDFVKIDSGSWNINADDQLIIVVFDTLADVRHRKFRAQGPA